MTYRPHALRRWQLQDAKNRLSELVRLAESEGPQLITSRGREAVVVLSYEEYERRVGGGDDAPSLFEILRNSPYPDVDIEFDTSYEAPETPRPDVTFEDPADEDPNALPR